jgi:hypothetical protein
MKQAKSVLLLALLLANLSWARAAAAQGSLPTATRTLQLSVFGAVTGDYTGLKSGRNLGITAGGDLGLPAVRWMRPTVELRGTYPIASGQVDSQKSISVGLKLEFLLNHRLRPYGDFLFGRGQMNYVGTGYVYQNNIYALTTTYVDSIGAGFEYQCNEHFALRADGQFQRWGAAPTPSGDVYSKVGSIGVVYFFTFDGRHRR